MRPIRQETCTAEACRRMSFLWPALIMPWSMKRVWYSLACVRGLADAAMGRCSCSCARAGLLFWPDPVRCPHPGNRLTSPACSSNRTSREDYRAGHPRIILLGDDKLQPSDSRALAAAGQTAPAGGRTVTRTQPRMRKVTRARVRWCHSEASRD